MVDTQRLATGKLAVNHRHHGLGVGVLDVGRVGKVDIGVRRAVQQQNPAGGSVGIRLDDSTVVDRFGITSAGHDCGPAPPRRTSAAGTAADRQPRTLTSTTAAAMTRAAPSPTMMPLTGTREISTKPVTTVPTIAPAVSIPATCPTTVPVSLRLLSRSLVTIGVTAASSAPGTMMASPAVVTSKESLITPAPRTANGVAATATPETASSGPSANRGEIRSARRPPAQEPIAM